MKHPQRKDLTFLFSSEQAKPLDFLRFLLWLAALLLISSLTLACSPQQQKQQNDAVTTSLLPGQQMWKNGVSSFLFGTNDTQEWTANNVETSPTIQQALKNARFTLMRTFFFDKSLLDGHQTSDAEIEQRLKTIENSGMICLGVLASVLNPTFVKHVVAYAGKRCNMYELGNEPDNSDDITMQQYIQNWNSLIPQLRKINPQAKFIGPVVADFTEVKDFLIGVKASGVFPDAISFHWYPCGGNDTSSACLAKVSTFAQVTTEVKGWVKGAFGKDLPVGITEWNYNADNPPASYGNDPKFITEFTTSALHFMMQAGLNFANQFDAASGAGLGGLDMFDIQTNKPKPQYTAIKNLIQQFLPATSPDSTHNTSTSSTAHMLPASIAFQPADKPRPGSRGYFSLLSS